MIGTYRVDKLDTSEIHIIFRVLIYKFGVMNRFRFDVFVVCQPLLVRSDWIGLDWIKRGRTDCGVGRSQRGRGGNGNRPSPRRHVSLLVQASTSIGACASLECIFGRLLM